MKNPKRFGFLLVASIAIVGWTSAVAQSNIVSDGSFESLRGAVPPGWEFTGGSSAYVNEPGAADGRCWLTAGTFAQNVATASGRAYRIRFALSDATVRVRWNGGIVSEVSSGGGGWNYTNFLVTATGSVSRVGFELGGSMDDISVGWMEEPPSITRPVPSRSSFEGGKVTFPVVVSGAPPLSLRWSFQGDLLPGATNTVLLLTNVQKQIEGDYVVVVSNAFGVAASLPATLAVRSIPEPPLIVSQPRNVQMTVGYRADFFVFAVGETPMSYHWKFNGTNVPGGTNSHFSIPSVSIADAGSYSVLVSNHFGTALSIGAPLTVQSGVGGGWVEWDNFNQLVNEGIYALVYGVDGVTLLEGPDFVAQPYVGATSNSLHAVGTPASFMTGSEAGYYSGLPVSVPDVLAGQTGYVQVRVWNQNDGESFEEASALGGEVGRSDVIAVVLGQPFAIPPPLRGLWSFNLQAGQPLLAAAKLYPDKVLPDGSLKWLVIGDPGARYIVEHRTPPNNWSPLMVLTNVIGVVSFVDTNAQNASPKFYRAQIIDQ